MDIVYNISEHMLYIERNLTMSDKEKLIQYIANLTNEEAEAFIAFLKTAPSSEEASMPLPPCNFPQEQTIAV